MWEFIEIKQRHLEAFTSNFRSLKPVDVASAYDLPLPELFGICLRAAIKAGWFGPNPPIAVEDVGELSPKEAMQQGKLVWRHFEQLTRIDPN